ncbi:hypothetical protein G7074_17380 [Pedobacter sp. HDW13]|uniref:hypothetical protein n=1 Tax=unclassified Pedobacter TaxID=2628915 RepID=UPI000F5AE9C0|nr:MULTISPECIES: hypothetical protein [unclassified Pedobacter]QIL40876.1 hypothetical protein G7074_17380 [Pedobacter sp. HDW13]RQO71312.1 hypothetical protein DBR40_15955 [Pedobacter sp. KBW01]
MNLTKEQLEELRRFIRQKGISYIDVQMEILDHVASSVEEKMTNKPDLDFENALKRTYKGFGVLGFNVIVNGIVNAIQKRYNRFFWKSFTSFFGFRYISIVCFSVLALYKMLAFIGKDEFYKFTIIGLLVITAGVLLTNFLIKDYKKYLSFKSGTSFPF